MSTFAIPPVGEPFGFDDAKGKRRTLPRLPDLDVDEFDEVMDELEAVRGDNRAAVKVARGVFERHCPGSTKGLTWAQLGALADAWATDGGEEAGEEGSSAD